MNGSKTFSLSAQDRKGFEMMCLRSKWVINRSDGVRNLLIRQSCDCELRALESECRKNGKGKSGYEYVKDHRGRGLSEGVTDANETK